MAYNVKNPKQKYEKMPMYEVKRINEEKGNYFFSKGATHFFQSKYPKEAIKKDGYAYFITSETNPSGKTAYTIRKENLESGNTFTVGEFHSYETRAEAQRDLDKYLAEDHKEPVEAPVENHVKAYELEPHYDSRKSFYGKANVREEDGKKILTSYSTDVAYIENGKAHVKGTYSPTTTRHIKEFLKQNGYKAESSKQIMADYGTNS